MSAKNKHGYSSKWAAEELNFIDANLEMSLNDLSAALGRHPVEVSRAKARLESRFLSEPWTTEEDEFVLSTPHLTARQVARHLERTYEAVATRRQILAREHNVKFGVHGANKSAFHIGARPLVAKTCAGCGLLLASEWFGFNSKQNGTGGWHSRCRQCKAGYANGKYQENGNQGEYHGSERYKQKSKESRDKLQALTVPRAKRGGQPWLESDHETLRDPDLSLLEKALQLQRSYNAVSIICSTNGYKSHVGIGSAERDQWIIDNPNAAEYAA